MKNQVFFATVVFIGLLGGSIATMAQETGLSGGIKAGPNATFFMLGTDSPYTKGVSKIGFSAGAFLKYDFVSWFAVQGDFILQSRNAELQKGNSGEELKYKSYTAELPLYGVFQTQVGTGKMFVGIGPYIGYGISSKIGGSDMYKKDGVDGLETTRLNYGAAATLGYDLGGFQINASYTSQYGIGVISNRSTMRHQTVGVGVGYSF
ncbi:outer membrane beta-barrel protein [Sphingobacterium tabacisoli]|uniref:Outer membrane beta-barrel protein n=1 Tax=Sphingobacterium tabacisoli TaxID=2044855 RepID=A0ABW5L4G0_9SPHI|nr:outer membrane beta-barrel protein [Sphingobacterium tabacisoli]